MNKILIIGRLTKDPLLKYTENKKPVVRLNIAVQRPYKSKEGKYEADFIPCVFWDRMAQTIGNYCSKGDQIGVSGRLSTRIYINNQNEKVYTTELIADALTLLGRKRNRNESVFIDEIFCKPEESSVKF